MKEEALKNFRDGYSCSESIVKAAIDAGLVDKALLPVATSFSGGMSSGCLCGTVAGAQMVLGALNGRNDVSIDSTAAKSKAKAFIDAFKNKHKATCCRVLSAGFEFHSPERRKNCETLVCDVAEILENMINNK